MGEALLKKQVASHLGCSIGELESRGVTIVSAGIAAAPGSPPSSQSVEVMSRMGLDISGCRSQPVTDSLIRSADVILTLTAHHKRAIDSRWPDAVSRTHTIRLDGQDISDPIGMPVKVYQDCAKQMEEQIAGWVEKIAPQIDVQERADGDES